MERFIITEAIILQLDNITLKFDPLATNVSQEVFDAIVLCGLEKQLGLQAKQFLHDVKMELYFHFDKLFDSAFTATDVQQFIYHSDELRGMFEKVGRWIAEEIKEQEPLRSNERTFNEYVPYHGEQLVLF